MKRTETLRGALAAHRIDGLLLASMSNIRYLSGFGSEERDVALLLVTAKRQILITDYRFAEQAREQCHDTEILVRDRARVSLGRQVQLLARECVIQRLGFEREHFPHGRWLDLHAELEGMHCTPLRGLVEQLRQVKDAQELASIRRAATIGDSAFDHLLGVLRPGISEREAAAELEYALKKSGAETLAFPTILTFGERTALPHGVPGERKLAQGDLIMVDFGAVVDGYRSDMTRTLVCGKADQKQRQIYALIREAQALGVAAVRAGIPAREPSDAVAEFLKRSPYAQFAGEGLGHCLGLDTHEHPYLAAGAETLLQENFVLTVEPGIYIPGWGGVRIEDDVRVTLSGAEILTHTTRELIEL